MGCIFIGSKLFKYICTTFGKYYEYRIVNNSSVSITELPDPLLQFLYRYLLGRLMLGFGKLKFLGTNAKHHCYIKGFLGGQPIPTRLGWLGYHLPVAAKFALIVMFIVEMIMPFLLYVGGLYKLSAGISFCANDWHPNYR